MKKLFKTEKALYTTIIAFNVIMLVCGIAFNNLAFWTSLLPLDIIIVGIISDFSL